jgi:K+-sensing histidine kinase KdpD
MKKPKEEIDSIPNSATSTEGDDHETAGRFLENASKRKVSSEKDRLSANFARRSRGRDLRERFQRFMAAAAFAEAGETGTALEIAYTHEKTTKVLLAIGGSHLNKDAFRYAVNLCRRMDASLDVLQVMRERPADTPEALRASLARHSEEIERLLGQVKENRVPVHVSVTVGDVDKEVYSYAKDDREVVAVVFDSPHVHREEPERGKWQRILQDLSRRLAIPLITAESKGPVGSLRRA